MAGSFASFFQSLQQRLSAQGSTYLSAPGTSAAVQDLALGAETIQKTQDELDEVKRRKKVLGDRGDVMMSPAVMALTGNSV